ncbi:MAG TPA: hypothetical protein VMT73_03175 [Anaerolineales bacterium]|nr:hypothetical protein [Anaerolineales bacterium]
MGKYSSDHRVVQQGPKGPHPIWRTIGCLMMIIVPLLSFFAALTTITMGIQNHWPLPNELMGYPQLPQFLFSTPGLSFLFSPIANANHFYAYIVFTLVYIMLLGGIVSFFYAVIYRFTGPSRYGPLDAPPIKGAKTKQYKR